MYKSVVYQGEMVLGEVEIYPVVENTQAMMMMDLMREVRITHFSPPSERCPPLAVLHTITSSGVCFKMESKTSESLDTPLYLLHSTCIVENKTAVMTLGGEELHLVAMFSRNNDKPYPCFWGFNVASGLYNSCLVMLNCRCLGIVFDLDETLIVANTMRSFEDRIEALQRKIKNEVDPQRIAGMMAEVKRYQDDKIILKQYVENDQVVENGKVAKIQSEIVPAFSDNHQPLVRPLIRLQEKNIILTRINPQIRDTSVLVRLRPAWEDLRSYLTAKGRKRFEVYVCTMAERDYALEMWRLLDPDSNLINSKDLLDRIVCVKAGLKKSLFNVFQDGLCHPKMALVIDDRLKVWDEKDQPRVHVVPAFAPYYAPQAEANNATPVLCVARNVACSVRGGFFKEFDEDFLQKIPEIAYEDDFRDTPSPPDVSNYLVSEDDSYALNGNRDSLSFDGMADFEVEKRLKEAITSLIAPSTETNSCLAHAQTLQHTIAPSSGSISLQTEQASMMPFRSISFPQVASLVKPLVPTAPPEPSLHSSPSREEGEVPESELDPDTRRRLLILQHGQDTRDHASSEPPFPVRPPVQVPIHSVQQRRGWFPPEQEMSPPRPSRVVWEEFSARPEPLHLEKHRPQRSFFPKVGRSISSGRVIHENKRLPKEGYHRNRSRLSRLRVNPTLSSHHFFSGEDMHAGRSSSGNREFEAEPKGCVSSVENPVDVLQDVAMKGGTKVDFRSSLVASTELQFSVQAWFCGEKIGEGIGRTRREAQQLAAESSLKNLDERISRAKVDSLSGCEEAVKFPTVNGNGKETSKISMGSVAALKELCIIEGLVVNFQPQFPPPPANSLNKDEVHAQVEIDGQVLGKGIGLTWDEAKTLAAEKALENLKSMLGPCNGKRQSSPRSLPGVKRMKQEVPRDMQRLPSSARYAQNTSPVL